MELLQEQTISAKERVLYAFFPRRCGLCGKVILPQDWLCADCGTALPVIPEPLCPHCGTGEADCSCEKRQNAYRQAAAPFYYEGSVRHGIHLFKFQDRRQNAAYLGRCMAHTAREVYAGQAFDLLTCVPLSKARTRERGYNQSALLMQVVAKDLMLPCEPRLLAKPKDNLSQRGFQIEQRRENVWGVYSAAKPELAAGKRILLVDDVTTTGATLNECAEVLLAAGAEAVYCLTAAVTKKITIL